MAKNMLQIQFELKSIKLISKLGKIKTGKWASVDGLVATLAQLFPEQATYFEQRNAEKLCVMLSPAGPVWPDADILSDFLFDDFAKALQEIKDKFSLAELGLAGIEYAENLVVGEEVKLYEDDLDTSISTIDIFEFYLLYQAAIKKEENSSTLILVSLDKDRHFAYLADKNTTLKDITAQEPALKELMHAHPQTKVYNPLKRLWSELDEPINQQGVNHLTLSETDLSAAPDFCPVFPFPQFKKKFKLQKDVCEGCPTECINCLACVEYCPADIYPNYLYHNLANANPTEAFDMNLKACRQCGKCSLVCPSKLPLYKTIRDGLNSEDDE